MKKSITENMASIVIWSVFLAIILFYVGYELGKDLYHIVN